MTYIRLAFVTLTINETDVRKKFIERKTRLHNSQTVHDNKRKTDITNRITELDGLLQSIYKDKVIGKVPENFCIGLLGKYQTEKKKLQSSLMRYLLDLKLKIRTSVMLTSLSLA